MRRLLMLAFLASAAPTLAQPYYRVPVEPIFNPSVLPVCDSAAHGAIFYSASDGTFQRCNGTWGNAMPNAAGGAAQAAICVSYLLWSPCSPTGVANCTVVGAGCVAATNLTAVGSKGATIALDMDTFSHCWLRYAGALASAQVGTVTVALRSYTDGTDWLTTSFASGTTCADRSSAVVDLTAKTGTHYLGLRLGDSVATDDPLLSGVTLTCCNQAFNW